MSTVPLVLFAIDPGLSGAIAYFKAGTLLDVWDVPTQAKKSGRDEVDPRELCAIFTRTLRAPRACIIERVAVMPRDGAMGAFGFGDSFGAIRAVAELNCERMHYATPGTWKKAMALTKDKDYSRTLAARYYPDAKELIARKKDHNRAEAILLGRYALQNFDKLF